MLNFFRKRASMVKIVFGVVLFLTCISMVVTLIPGLTGVTPDQSSGEVVAKVGKDQITTTDLQQQLQQQSRQNNIPAEMSWLYLPQVLDGIVMRKIVAQDAEQRGLSVSEDELKAHLKQIPDFFPNGKFVGEQQYEDMITQRVGTSVQDWERTFRDNILQQKLTYLVTDSITVSDDEVHQAFLHDNEKLILKYVFFDPEAIKKEIVPTDAQLQEYFQKNHDRYTIPEKRTVQILLITAEALKQGTTITDQERQTYYQQHMDEFRIPERVSVQHILLKASPQDKAKMDQAKAKAEGLLKQIKAGADFGELAKKNSDDAANASKGGDLGWVVRGQTVPEFEKAAFSLAPGSVSDPVRTEYGIHLIKVNAHEQAHVRTLQEAQADIDKALLDEKLQGTLETTAAQAAAEWRSNPQNLSAIQGKYHANVLLPPALAHDDQIPGMDGGAPVLEEAFTMEKGKIGEPVQVTGGYAIPMLKDTTLPHPAEFAEVKDRVRTDYVTDQAKDRAQAKALELAQAVEKQGDNRDLDKAAKALKLTAETTQPLARTGAIPSVGSLSDLGPSLDTMQPGKTAGPVAIGGGQIVYELVSRQAPTDAEFANQKDLFRQRLLAQKQAVAFATYEQDLKTRLTNSGNVKIYQDVMAKLTASQQR